MPFILHEYTALPPFAGVAVKLTGAPWQIEFALEERFTEAAMVGLTVIITKALSALREVHPRLEIIFTQTVSWLLIAFVVKVGELVPTAVPFFLQE